jgi:hypothetical protein
MSLTGKIGGDFSIGEVPTAPVISGLRFGRRSTTADSSAAFVSTIISGSVKLIDVARDQSLEPNAALQLNGFRGYITDFRKVKEGFEFGFAGTVSQLRVGPAGFADDISPTALDYLYHQEWIKLMWVVAAALFAALAKVRSWLAEKFSTEQD